MCFAEHLTVVDGCFAAFAPSRNVVGIHFFQLPDTMRILIVTDCAVRTVADTLSLGLIRLLLIHLTHSGLIEQTDVQQARFLTTAQHKLKDALMV